MVRMPENLRKYLNGEGIIILELYTQMLKSPSRPSLEESYFTGQAPEYGISVRIKGIVKDRVASLPESVTDLKSCLTILHRAGLIEISGDTLISDSYKLTEKGKIEGELLKKALSQ